MACPPLRIPYAGHRLHRRSCPDPYDHLMPRSPRKGPASVGTSRQTSTRLTSPGATPTAAGYPPRHVSRLADAGLSHRKGDRAVDRDGSNPTVYPRSCARRFERHRRTRMMLKTTTWTVFLLLSLQLDFPAPLLRAIADHVFVGYTSLGLARLYHGTAWRPSEDNRVRHGMLFPCVARCSARARRGE
jgi:hypothetical protein